MDLFNVQAVNSLKATLNSLLPAIADASIQRQLVVHPAKITPVGLGGFITLNANPLGEVLGRQIEAIALVDLQAPTTLLLHQESAAITASLIGENRGALRNQGIFSIVLDQLGLPERQPIASGQFVMYQSLTFRVNYEFLKYPQANEDVIRQVPINLNLS